MAETFGKGGTCTALFAENWAGASTSLPASPQSKAELSSFKKKKKNVLNRSSSHLQSDNFPKKKSGFFKWNLSFCILKNQVWTFSALFFFFKLALNYFFLTSKSLFQLIERQKKKKIKPGWAKHCLLLFSLPHKGRQTVKLWHWLCIFYFLNSNHYQILHRSSIRPRVTIY